MELARIYLQAKNVGKELWAEVVAKAVYVINLSEVSEGKALFQLEFKDILDLKSYILLDLKHICLSPKVT